MPRGEEGGREIGGADAAGYTVRGARGAGSRGTYRGEWGRGGKGVEGREERIIGRGAGETEEV